MIKTLFERMSEIQANPPPPCDRCKGPVESFRLAVAETTCAGCAPDYGLTTDRDLAEEARVNRALALQ